MTPVHPVRHLLRAKNLVDASYRESLDVPTEELKSRGVEFLQEPTEQPYGVDAGFRDPSGNQFRLAQVR